MHNSCRRKDVNSTGRHMYYVWHKTSTFLQFSEKFINENCVLFYLTHKVLQMLLKFCTLLSKKITNYCSNYSFLTSIQMAHFPLLQIPMRGSLQLTCLGPKESAEYDGICTSDVRQIIAFISTSL